MNLQIHSSITGELYYILYNQRELAKHFRALGSSYVASIVEHSINALELDIQDRQRALEHEHVIAVKSEE